MESLIIEATEGTPAIKFNPLKHILEVTGESRPEDSRKFYTPVINWFAAYKAYLNALFRDEENAKKITVTCEIKLTYFNSSSAKFIMDIFHILKECKAKFSNMDVVINWYYHMDDEDMKDAGTEFEKLTGLEFYFLSFRD